MVVVLKEQGLAYFIVPKSAGTSICHALHAAITGERFDGDVQDIHTYYPTYPVGPEDFATCRPLWKFAVLRDPVKRLLSAYQNRVIDHGDLDEAFGVSLRTRFGAWRRGLSLRPGASAFFERHDAYARYSRLVRQHTLPIHRYIGSDLSYFDALYTMADLPKLAADLSARLGQEIAFERFNEGGRPPAFQDLSPAAQRKVRELTVGDYDLLSRYFAPPAAAPEGRGGPLRA
ncbi:MAG: sulfotransferase family 2 domain-containing protein [Pseudomonadota bacterium]